MSEFEFTVPIIVVGAGACGAIAALAAADAGVPPLVIEREDRPFGSTGMSQGLFCAAGTSSQAEAGIEDDAETFFNDIMEKARGLTDPVIAGAIARNSADTYEWMRTKLDMAWELDRTFGASYGNSRQRVHGWKGHSGLDMVQLLHRRMSDHGIDVMLETKLVDIFTDGANKVTGVALQGPDGNIEKIGCEALILAGGGFGHNREMTNKFMPETANLRYNGHEGSDGEGIFIPARLGAALGDMGSYQGYAMLTDPQGIPVPPPVLIEGGLIVNKLGARFTDESDDIAGMVHPLAAQPDGLGWVIYDAAIEAKTKDIPELRELIELNAPKYADSLEELAGLINVDVAALKSSVEGAQATAAAGEADSFGRRWDGNQPPQGPYRAIKVVGALFHTQGGLQVNEEARVMREDGGVFENMFAGGGNARSVSGPSSWGYLPAMGLTTAVVLGRLAGIAAARTVNG